ncbi:MAG: dUTP diphosphatase [Phycisphaerae bacterium]|nr:dUTP diphosphatase [Phycisphaerae bacterium]
MLTLRIKRVAARAEVPRFQTEGSAGLDLAACLPEGQDAMRVEPGQIVRVPTGWAVAIPEGYEGQVRPRSGLATRFGVTVVNAPGTIDSDYRGEVMVALINLGSEAYEIVHGTRVAQLVVGPVARVAVEEVADLGATGRGSGGFGSTGGH